MGKKEAGAKRLMGSHVTAHKGYFADGVMDPFSSRARQAGDKNLSLSSPFAVCRIPCVNYICRGIDMSPLSIPQKAALADWK